MSQLLRAAERTLRISYCSGSWRDQLHSIGQQAIFSRGLSEEQCVSLQDMERVNSREKRMGEKGRREVRSVRAQTGLIEQAGYGIHEL
jgi:hypothetical protein